jgi:hypothetical protein
MKLIPDSLAQIFTRLILLNSVLSPRYLKIRAKQLTLIIIEASRYFRQSTKYLKSISYANKEIFGR